MDNENEGVAVTSEASDDQATDTGVDEGVENTDQGSNDEGGPEGSDDEGMSLTDENDDNSSSDDDEDGDENNDDEGEEEPVTYEDFDLPENVDQGMLEATTAVFAKHKLSQEVAQDIISEYAKQIELGQQAQADAIAEVHKEWAKELKSDREFGGDKFAATAKSAKGAFSKYADDDMVQLMKDTGLNKHPAILRTFAKIGRDVLEDEISDDPAITKQRSIVDDWYK